MRKAVTICGIIFSILLTCILIFNVIFLVRNYSDSESLPSAFGYTPLIVQSGSMEPAINIGDLIFIRQSKADNLRAGQSDGDIITYRSGNSYVTHRAVDLIYDDDENLFIQTKGDANNAADTDYVSAEDFIGTYVQRIPYLGDAVLFLQTPAGMLLLIIVPICIIFALEGRKLKKRLNADKEEMAALREQLTSNSPAQEDLAE